MNKPDVNYQTYFQFKEIQYRLENLRERTEDEQQVLDSIKEAITEYENNKKR